MQFRQVIVLAAVSTAAAFAAIPRAGDHHHLVSADAVRNASDAR